ncbi:MAG: hypothetical protein M3Q69_13385 [Acidobacteriota bacterium]|nr:hypothetical protein [Acidobacteriota bacterium]
MRSRNALLRKDARELFGSTAFLLVLLLAGPLVGLSFIAAVRAYAEASGSGGAAALASALSPLDGLLVPTFGAYELLITFLVPFVAIRTIANEKSSGAQELLLQTRIPLATQLASKLLALVLGWVLLLVPALLALVLWRSYGGHLDAGETANLLLGHTLRYVVTCALALAAASMMQGAASAAIVVLTVTIGTWALDFFATGRGGAIATLARFTPAAMLRQFERGLLSVSVVVAALLIAAAFSAIAALFLDLRLPWRTRTLRVAVVVFLAVLMFAVIPAQLTKDVSEDRRNSFSPADERLLRSIDAPLRIAIYMAAEDPRAADYERNVLTKLRRNVRSLHVEYPYAGRTALFDNDERYGTVEYRLRETRAVSRSTTEEIVLDEIEALAGLTPPQRGESTYPGYPLHAQPRGAGVAFYVVWPLLVLGVRWQSHRFGVRRQSRRS